MKPSDVLSLATNEIALGSKLGADATKRLTGECSERPWPPVIRIGAPVKVKVGNLFNL